MSNEQFTHEQDLFKDLENEVAVTNFILFFFSTICHYKIVNTFTNTLGKIKNVSDNSVMATVAKVELVEQERKCMPKQRSKMREIKQIQKIIGETRKKERNKILCAHLKVLQSRL